MRNFAFRGISLHLSRIDRIEKGEWSACFSVTCSVRWPLVGQQSRWSVFMTARIWRLHFQLCLCSKSLNNNNNEQSADEVEATTNRTRARTTDGTCSEAQQPPVFRHLNAEFRQQLQLKKSRSRSIENRLDETVSPSKILSPTDSHPSSSHQSGMTVVAVNSAAAGGSDENGCCPNGDVVVINSPRSAIAANDTDQQNLAGHRFLRVRKKFRLIRAVNLITSFVSLFVHVWQILDDERQRLNRLILEAEVYLADAAVVSSEELTGKIRAAIGKWKLLLAQKFEKWRMTI